MHPLGWLPGGCPNHLDTNKGGQGRKREGERVRGIYEKPGNENLYMQITDAIINFGRLCKHWPHQGIGIHKCLESTTPKPTKDANQRISSIALLSVAHSMMENHNTCSQERGSNQLMALIDISLSTPSSWQRCTLPHVRLWYDKHVDCQCMLHKLSELQILMQTLTIPGNVLGAGKPWLPVSMVHHLTQVIGHGC